MSGAGSSSAGSGPAGFDPIATSTGPLALAAAQAWFYDPELRDFTIDDAGDALAVHPVDQAVAMASTVALGSLASAPDTGCDFDAIKSAPRRNQQATVTDKVSLALAAFVDGGDIEFFGAPIVQQGPGRLLWAIEYANLRLPGAPRRRLVVSS